MSGGVNTGDITAHSTPADQAGQAGFTRYEGWDLPNDKEGLLRTLHALQITVADFKRMPVYRDHVNTIPWLRQLNDRNDPSG